jgi:YNFM family putative membrane transporter
MGLYVGGTAIGGMAGRVIAGTLADRFTWRIAVAAIGVLGLVAMLAFRMLLPPSRHFTPRRGAGLAMHRTALAAHLADPALRVLIAMGFVLMGSFVTLYNYVGYRLLGPPYRLSQAQIGAIFLVYLVGVIASPMSGRLADALGRPRVLTASLILMLAGVALTLFASIAAVVAGIAFVTFGFFAAHAVTSGWIGRRAKAAKGQAAALYLLAYYLGSSVVGWWGGHWFAAYGWHGVATLVATLIVCGILAAGWLATQERSTG